MPLFITKITDASSNTDYSYLDSEHLWNKRLSSTYTFSILDVQFDDGSDHLLEGIEALQLAYQRQNLAAKIGIDEFKNGNIVSMSLPESNRVGQTTATITIEEQIRTSDDEALSLISDNIPSPQLVDSFSESFNFSRSENSYSYTRDIALRYKYDAAEEFLNNAYLFLKNIYLGSRPSYGFLEDGISENGRFNLGLKPLINEVYDIINKEVRLTENFSSFNIIESSNIKFSRNQTHSQSLNSEGYTEKKYNVEIKALQEPLENVLDSGVQISLNEILSDNASFLNPISIEKTVNSDGGLGTLSVGFTNDPRKNQTTTVDYKGSKSEGGDFDEYSFSMDVKTKGFNWNTAFDTSKEYLKTNKNLGLEKLQTLFAVDSGLLNEISRDVSYNPFEKKAAQSVDYSLDPAFKDNGDGILFRRISVSDENQINRNEVIPVYGDTELIISKDNAKTLGSRKVSVEITALNDIAVDSGFLIANGHLPPYNYYYMNSKKSSNSPLSNAAKTDLEFTFFD